MRDILNAMVFAQLMVPGEAPATAYKRLAKIWHPDRHMRLGADPHLADKIFKHINALYHTETAPVALGEWTVKAPEYATALASFYRTTEGHTLKIVNDKCDNDLMDREKVALETLNLRSNFTKYVPILEDAFLASGRRVNVLSSPLRERHSLQQIVDRVPNLEFRHIVWMMNRALSVLGYAHRKGLFHGAVLPSNLLYETDSHGLQLVDWCYSGQLGKDKISVIDERYSALYPDEVTTKRPAIAATDLFMLGHALWSTARITCFDIPTRFIPIFEYMTDAYIGARAQDAWALQDIWKAAAQEVYGDPKFLELHIPSGDSL